MSAREENSLTENISTLGIIAGSGIIPQQLQQACSNQNIKTLVIGIKGATDHVSPDFWTRVGTTDKTLKWFKEKGVTDIVLIGAVKRPNFFDLWPDWPTAKFFFKVWVNALGDDSLLSTARQEVEKLGFKIHGVHKFLPKLLMPVGVVGRYKPQDNDQVTIQTGIEESQKLGEADIGQAVIVKGKDVVAREDSKGTNALINKHGCKGGILVKTCKPQQDRDLDLPTIGPETMQLCAQKKMLGVVAQAKQTLFVGQEEAIEIANTHKMFVMGVALDATE